jgi:hypothetical protein
LLATLASKNPVAGKACQQALPCWQGLPASISWAGNAGNAKFFDVGNAKFSERWALLPF